MQLYTATPAVLALCDLNITGNILPPAWLHHLKFDNGKPNAIAAIILSDIVYWYRPVELRDETTGLVTGYAQKFKADKLQRTYDSYVQQYGFTYHQIKAGFACLVATGVIDLEFRTVRISKQRCLGNVMFIGLAAETLQHISDPSRLEPRSPSRLEPRSPSRLEPRSPSRLEPRTLQRLHNTEITDTENTDTENCDDDGVCSPPPFLVQEKNAEDPRVEIRADVLAMQHLAYDLIQSMGPNVWTDVENYIIELPTGRLVPLLSWLWLWKLYDDAKTDPYASSSRYKHNPFQNVESVPGKIITQVRRNAQANLLDAELDELAAALLQYEELYSHAQ